MPVGGSCFHAGGLAEGEPWRSSKAFETCVERLQRHQQRPLTVSGVARSIARHGRAVLLSGSFVASLLCAFYLALDMCQAVCPVKCQVINSRLALSCFQALVIGSEWFRAEASAVWPVWKPRRLGSEAKTLQRHLLEVRVPESALLELIEAASEVNDLDQGIAQRSMSHLEEAWSSRRTIQVAPCRQNAGEAEAALHLGSLQ